jgi:molybdopterin molybdotransferase
VTFPQKLPAQMLSVSEAQGRILSYFSAVDSVAIPIQESVGRVLSEDIIATLDLPAFNNSAVDGFAVKLSDLKDVHRDNPVRLKVVADIPAGSDSVVTLSSGQTARIMTGALVPENAEAIVPVEDTDFNYRQLGMAIPETVGFYQEPDLGAHIRSLGEDVRMGERVLAAGKVIRPQDIGFLSMLGIPKVHVRRKPQIAIFSTGDELLPVETPLSPGKIHDSNSYMLKALVEQLGADAWQIGIVPDQAEAVEDCLDRAVLQRVDLILSSAGVSVGAFDFVRSVVERNGSLDFWRVNMRPGKPLAFGNYKGFPFIGLPGNPVSAYVGFEIFVRPAILKMLDLSNTRQPLFKAQLLEDVISDGRESYLRGVITEKDGQFVARLTGHQGSGNLLSLVQGNALLIIPAKVKSLPAGSEVDFRLISGSEC